MRRVFSHEVALNQCRDFFAAHKAIEQEIYYDTAGSVKMIMRDHPPGGAALASELAAKIYGARILKSGIEDDPQNYTRFFFAGGGGSESRGRHVDRAGSLGRPRWYFPRATFPGRCFGR